MFLNEEINDSDPRTIYKWLFPTSNNAQTTPSHVTSSLLKKSQHSQSNINKFNMYFSFR